MKLRFDDSLPTLARVVAQELGGDALSQGVVLRDAVGRLAFFTPVELDDAAAGRLSERLRSELGAYARPDRTVATGKDFGVREVLDDSAAFPISRDGFRLRLIDRRIVGADWLRRPSPMASAPQRFVFASIKGGVGRSTALSVAAANIAAQGGRALAIDLDMEAPGLGPMLLKPDGLPEFGLIDALVESGLAPLDDEFYVDLVAPSPLADRRGRIDVLPALGRRSMRNPGDVLSKIARAYIEHVNQTGTVLTILDEVRAIADRFSSSGHYDAILLDARAGLHETTAAAVLGLGAEVFLFGLDEPQTFEGYSALLAHMARFLPETGEPPEWLNRITMIHAKASPDRELRLNFAERCRDLFSKSGLLVAPAPLSRNVPLPAAPFSDVPWEEDSDDDAALVDEVWDRPTTLAILEDDRFRLFHPHDRADVLSENVYRASYGAFLDYVNQAIQSNLGMA